MSKNDKWRERSHLDLHSNENWVKFVADLQMAPAAARGQQPQAPKRLLSDPSGWLKELQVPKVLQRLNALKFQ